LAASQETEIGTGQTATRTLFVDRVLISPVISKSLEGQVEPNSTEAANQRNSDIFEEFLRFQSLEQGEV
jgi:hypothetical protein